jgi:hypothetical protein
VLYRFNHIGLHKLLVLPSPLGVGLLLVPRWLLGMQFDLSLFENVSESCRIAIVDSSEGGLMWCFFVTRSFVCRRIMGCYGLQPADPACSGPSAESIPTSPLVPKLHL